MIITCPNCSTRYLVAEDKIGEQGRRVRCAKCSHIWFQDPPLQDAPDAPLGDDAAPAAVDRSAAPSPPPPPPPSHTPPVADPGLRSQVPAIREEPAPRSVWWVLVIALLLLTPFMVGVVFFEDIMRVVRGQSGASTAVESGQAPPEPVSIVDGTEVPSIQVSTGRARLETVDGMRILTLPGSIYNPAEVAQPVPELTFELVDASFQVIDRWSFRVPFETIEAGATESFEGMLRNPPNDLATLRQRQFGAPVAPGDSAAPEDGTAAEGALDSMPPPQEQPTSGPPIDPAPQDTPAAPASNPTPAAP